MDVKREEDFAYFDELAEPLGLLERAFQAAGEDIRFEGAVDELSGIVWIFICRGPMHIGQVEVNRIMPADVLKDVAAAVSVSGARIAREVERWTA
jgi:hypothetical protein